MSTGLCCGAGYGNMQSMAVQWGRLGPRAVLGTALAQGCLVQRGLLKPHKDSGWD